MFTAVKKRIEQLKNNENKRVFSQVKSALSLGEVKGKAVPAPYCAFLVPISDVPKNLEADKVGNIDEMTSTIAVIIGVQSRNDPTGEKGNELLQDVKTLVRNRLSAYSPERGYSGFKLKGGKLFGMADNGLWWIEQFSTTHIVESTYDNT